MDVFNPEFGEWRERGFEKKAASSEPLQFGEPIENPLIRVSVYGVILNEKNEVLVVEVRGKHHLPGGGIDEGEDEQEALVREVREESGYEILDLQLIGKADQYLPNASLGPMKKLGTFYTARAGAHHPSVRVEADHLPQWMNAAEIMNSTMTEFQKWAVSEVFPNRKKEGDA